MKYHFPILLQSTNQDLLGGISEGTTVLEYLCWGGIRVPQQENTPLKQELRFSRILGRKDIIQADIFQYFNPIVLPIFLGGFSNPIYCSVPVLW